MGFCGMWAFFGDLCDEECDKILAIARRVEFHSGETIMREDEQGETMYLFVEGEVDVTKNLTLKLGERDFAQGRKIDEQAERGTCLGFRRNVHVRPRTTERDDHGEHRLRPLRDPPRRFRRPLQAEPRLGFSVLQRMASVLCSRVRKGNEDVLKLSTALSMALSR